MKEARDDLSALRDEWRSGGRSVAPRRTGEQELVLETLASPLPSTTNPCSRVIMVYGREIRLSNIEEVVVREGMGAGPAQQG